MSKDREYCDNCGDDITDTPYVTYSHIPFSVASANRGESAILCKSCNKTGLLKAKHCQMGECLCVVKGKRAVCRICGEVYRKVD